MSNLMGLVSQNLIGLAMDLSPNFRQHDRGSLRAELNLDVDLDRRMS